MSVTNNIVSKPITIREVAKLIGYSGNDLGRLCTHANINMWSKYKPFRSNKLFFAQDTNSASTDRDTAMRNANYGLQPPSARSSATISNCFDDVWTYNKPRGGSYSEYFRLADFINYAHADKPPMVAVGDININLFWNEATSIQLSRREGTGSVNRMEFSDFSFLDNYPRIGILLQGDTNMFICVYDSMPSVVIATINAIKSLNFAVGETIRYALLATNHAATSGFTSDIATSSWFALPNDAANSIFGTIVFSDDLHLNISVSGARSATGQSWALLSNCYGTMPADGGDIYYYLPTQQYNYSVQMRFSITNTGEAVTVKKSLFTIYLDKNLTSNMNTKRLAPKAMYDEDGNSVDSIDIAAGATVNIGFQLPDYIFTMDAQGNHSAIVKSGRRMAVNINLCYNGVQNAIKVQNFRLRDN